MLDYDVYRQLRNGKRCQTSIERTMSDQGGTEEKETEISSENVEREVFGNQTLIQEAASGKKEGLLLP